MANQVLVVGATGTIGSAVVQTLRDNDIQVIAAARSGTEHVVDLSEPESIKTLLENVGELSGIISCAGSAKFVPIPDATDEDWSFSLTNKLMGQINLVRFGRSQISKGGSITLTTGVLADQPMAGSSILTTVNAGLQGFVRSTPLELEGIRVNAVSPGWISETLAAMGENPAGGTPAADIAQLYLAAVQNTPGGDILSAN